MLDWLYQLLDLYASKAKEKAINYSLCVTYINCENFAIDSIVLTAVSQL